MNHGCEVGGWCCEWFSGCVRIVSVGGWCCEWVNGCDAKGLLHTSFVDANGCASSRILCLKCNDCLSSLCFNSFTT